MGIALNANGAAAQVGFILINSSTGLPITGYSFTLGEVRTKVPSAAIVSQPITDIVEIGNGFYVVQLQPGQTTTAGLVLVAVDVSTAILQRVVDRIDPAPLTAVAVADAVMSYVVENGKSLLNYVRIIKAGVAGKANGFSTPTRNYRDDADTKNRITATVDATGRTSVTTDGS